MMARGWRWGVPGAGSPLPLPKKPSPREGFLEGWAEFNAPLHLLCGFPHLIHRVSGETPRPWRRILSVVLASLALVIACAALTGAVLLSKRGPAPPEQPYDDETLRADVAEIWQQLKAVRAEYSQHMAWRTDIELAVDEGIRDVTRTRNRIQATVRRAREQLEEAGHVSPGLEAEAADLRDDDGERGEGDGVQPVPANMDPARAAAIACLPGDFS